MPLFYFEFWVNVAVVGFVNFQRKRTKAKNKTTEFFCFGLEKVYKNSFLVWRLPFRCNSIFIVCMMCIIWILNAIGLVSVFCYDCDEAFLWNLVERNDIFRMKCLCLALLLFNSVAVCAWLCAVRCERKQYDFQLVKSLMGRIQARQWQPIVSKPTEKV